MADSRVILVIIQGYAATVLIGACCAITYSLVSAPFLVLPALLLAWGCVGLHQLKRWGGMLVCAMGWCAVAFLLFASALYGLTDTSYPTAFADPSFAVFFWSVVGFTGLTTSLVVVAWRDLIN